MRNQPTTTSSEPIRPKSPPPSRRCPVGGSNAAGRPRLESWFGSVLARDRRGLPGRTPGTPQGMSVAETAAPEGPTELSERSWGGGLKRTVAEFRADNLTDWAASLTYYAVLALFPAIIALLSIVGLAGKSATDTLIENVKTVTSGPANDVLTNAFNSLSRDRGAAGLVLVFGLLLSLWSASAYIGAFARASNAIYE